MSSKKYIFYHIFCNERTYSVVNEQIHKIVFSGLYKTVDQIYCFLTGDPNIIENIKQLIEKSGKKFVIGDIGIHDTSYERFTLTRIYNYIQPTDKFLYIHSKGVTHPNNNKNVHDWRSFMEYHLFTRHHECIKLLDDYDAVGPNLLYSPNIHFSGNLWWARGDFYLKLDTNRLYDYYGNSNYIAPEMFLGTGEPRIFEIANGNKDGYSESNPMKEYIDKE